jgi:hypothetical protein
MVLLLIQEHELRCSELDRRLLGLVQEHELRRPELDRQATAAIGPCAGTSSGGPTSRRLRLEEHELWRPVPAAPSGGRTEAFAVEVQASDPSCNFPVVLPVSNLDPSHGIPRGGRRCPAFLSQFYSFTVRVVPNASTGVPQGVFPNAGGALDFETVGGAVLVCIRRRSPGCTTS